MSVKNKRLFSHYDSLTIFLKIFWIGLFAVTIIGLTFTFFVLMKEASYIKAILGGVAWVLLGLPAIE